MAKCATCCVLAPKCGEGLFLHFVAAAFSTEVSDFRNFNEYRFIRHTIDYNREENAGAGMGGGRGARRATFFRGRHCWPAGRPPVI